MKLRGNKHWELLKNNTRPCDQCGKVRKIAMLGKDGGNKDDLLCKRCASKWGEAERQVFEKLKALLRFIRRHLISIVLIFTFITALDVAIISHYVEEDRGNKVQILTEWAYPKANERVSKSQVQETIEAHCKHSTMPEHTLAILMAESRFFPSATNTKVKDAWGGGQVRWKVWKEILQEAGIIQNDERDLFDIEVTARAVSFILNHYMSLLPDDLRTPGIKITYALTMYNGHSKGKAVMRGLARRNNKLTNKELREIISKLDYPVEVLAYVGEMAALYPETDILQQIRDRGRGYIKRFIPKNGEKGEVDAEKQEEG